MDEPQNKKLKKRVDALPTNTSQRPAEGEKTKIPNLPPPHMELTQIPAEPTNGYEIVCSLPK